MTPLNGHFHILGRSQPASVNEEFERVVPRPAVICYYSIETHEVNTKSGNEATAKAHKDTKSPICCWSSHSSLTPRFTLPITPDFHPLPQTPHPPSAPPILFPHLLTLITQLLTHLFSPSLTPFLPPSSSTSFLYPRFIALLPHPFTYLHLLHLIHGASTLTPSNAKLCFVFGKQISLQEPHSLPGTLHSFPFSKMKIRFV